MKKLLITIVLVLGLSIGAFAEYYYDGGLFQRGIVSDEWYYGAGYFRDGNLYTPILPYHELETNQPADEAPLTGGIAVLFGLGVAYAFKKREKK